MAMSNYDVIFIDDETTMTDIFNQYVNWKYKHWRACAFVDSQDLYDRITANQVSAVVWIVDIMMPRKNGTEIAAAIVHECAPGTIILGYTALDPYSLEARPEYVNGLKHFSRIINKQENFNNLLDLVDVMVKQKAI
jgi:DNA-binding NtrC family response regulator